MTDLRSDRTLKALLEADAVPAPSDPASQGAPVEWNLPSLDERVEMFLQAVHGPEHMHTAQAGAAARELILGAMASELAEQTAGSSVLPSELSRPLAQAAAVRSEDRAPNLLVRLAAGFRRAATASEELFGMRAMRWAAVPLVAVLAAGSLWSTRSIYFGPGTEEGPSRLPQAEAPALPPPPATRGLAPSPDAEEALRRRIFSAESTLGPTHPDVADLIASLAWLYQSERRHVEAEALYERALAIRERALGPRHPEVAATLNRLAEVYRVRGRDREAREVTERAAAILETPRTGNMP